MNTFSNKHYYIRKDFLPWLLLGVMLGFVTNNSQAALSQVPLFLTTSVTPIVMLNISKEHQLFFKAFDDYSDLDKLSDGGIPETTYKHSINYYGYFDSFKCYSYVNSQFEPTLTTSNKYCGTGLWSGNFLNWASMTRIDTIRKILYGGLRSTDIGGVTSTTSTSTTPVVTTVTTKPVVTTVGPITSTTPVAATGPTTSAGTTLMSGTSCAAAKALLPSNTSNVLTTATTGPTTTYSTPSPTSSTANDAGFPVSTVNGPTTQTDNSATTSALTYANNSKATTVSTSTPILTTTTYTFNGACTSTGSGSSKYQQLVNKTISTQATTTTKTTTTVTTATQTDTQAKSTNYVSTVNNLGQTVLERTYLPNDAHSFAKFYNGSDLNQLTPYNSASGITLCNTTVSGTTLSQNVTDAPLIRVAIGDFSLWSANERWQCRWSGEKTASNGNAASSGLNASANNPSKNSSGSADFNARVKVCVNGLINTENCKTYPDGTIKPIGLLQTYGDDDKLRFGMMTGSYGKNKSGGVLRKNVSSITDEINVTTNGTFKTAPSTGAIINTLSKLRLHGYRHDDGTYFGVTNSDACTWGWNTFTDGQCTNWGNPQSEIFLESLRYLGNNSPLSAFLPTSPTDASYISDMTVATPTDPIISTQWCAALNVIQFNASTSSYDGDQLGNVTDLGATAMNPLTDAVGTGENIPGNSYFVGENGTDNNQLCTAKTVSALSSVTGTCPDAPRLSGTYHIAGLAYYAHNNDIRSGLQGNQTVTTYGVALSPALPKVVIPVPGNSGKQVTILPACRNSSVGGNCAIVDFKIVHQDCSLLGLSSSSYKCGKFYVNWEDSEQGGDFDQDMWGVLTYSVSSTQVNISTAVIAQSTPNKMGFGYILSGTSKDGFHVHSGINAYAYSDPKPGTLVTGSAGTGTGAYCVSCGPDIGYLGPPDKTATTVTYPVGSSSANSLQQPLYYAAKWGGFTDSNNNGIPDLQTEWDNNGDGKPDRYFLSTNPSQLATALNDAFSNVIASNSAASAVAANSTQLNTGTQVYQAKFNSKFWSGQIQSYNVNIYSGALTPGWEASALLPAPTIRNILTYDPTAASGSRGIAFQWSTTTPLSTSQQNYLNILAGVNDGKGADRVNWLRGDHTNEQSTGGIFRNRTNVLGDIINSDPFYVGNVDYGYGTLSGSEGSSYVSFRASSAYTSRKPMLYVGANDGMLHGFDASITGGQEILAYIPDALFPELSKLTSPSYAHQYYVDGLSAASDVYDGSTWHTVLAGTTGAGGRAVFALDVTNPASFGTASALWEFTNLNDVDLGNTMAQPSVVRLQDGHWAVIVANGYNSDNGHAVLFVLDALTGVVLQKIDTGEGTTSNKNGLSSPIAVDTNNDRSVDTVYAGDLYGNLWKFDLSGSAGSYPIPSSPFFVACTTSGITCSTADRQPITAKPNVGNVGATGTDQNGVGRMLYFGTGKYFETGDNIVSTNPQVQTFYGLWDKGSSITDRANLQEQTIDFEGNPTTVSGVVSTKSVRVVSKNTVCFAATSVSCTSSSSLKSGWALNLISPINGVEGERVVSFPLVRRGLVVFATAIPSPDPCKSGGKSWLMEVDALGGGEYGGAPFDVDGNGIVDLNDFVLINGVKHAASGTDQDIGITKTPAVIESTDVDFKYSSGSTGAMGTVTDAGGGKKTGVGSNGTRRSWRQLK